MYCPQCGSQNKPDTKFCTRCGMNLGVVSDALAGRKVSPLVEERLLKTIRDFARGRRDATTGAVLIPAGLMVMAILVFAGLPPVGAFFICCWMFFWGASALASGLGKWAASSAEMKAIGFDPAHGGRTDGLLERSTPQERLAEPSGYSTDPLAGPASVTEHTTRELRDRPSASIDRSSHPTG